MERKCKNCNRPLENKYGINFCSQSCAASFNNKMRKTNGKNNQRQDERRKMY